MPATINAEKYTYTVRWSEKDGAYLATVKEWPSLVADGDFPLDAVGELMEVVQDCLDDMQKTGETPPEPTP